MEQNSVDDVVLALADAWQVGPDRVGAKAAMLTRLAGAGYPVPAGFVVTTGAFGADGLLPAVADRLTSWGARLGGGRLAVRSSAVAEDRPGASFAGLYESLLDVEPSGLVDAVERSWRSAATARVAVYQAHQVGRAGDGPESGPRDGVREVSGGGAGQAMRAVPDTQGAGMAVLVQCMVDATAAGVAFTANPLSGARDETVVSAVPGLGEALVGGQATGEEWIVRDGHPMLTRPGTGTPALSQEQAGAVVGLARGVEAELGGPQDVEWALDRDGRLFLLQARPMTAVPEPVDWSPPAPGHWMRTFRLGEWLPEPMTPLFADWLLSGLEAGYLAGMRDTVGVAVPFRYASINGWYYTAPPRLSPGLLVRVLSSGRVRLVRVLVNALIRSGRNPAAADRAVLAGLAEQWRKVLLLAYLEAVADATEQVEDADAETLVGLVDRLADLAGRYLWSLAIVGGSAWKIETALARFCQEHLLGALDGEPAQRLLAGLPGVDVSTPAHAVLSIDWFHPTAGELGLAQNPTEDRQRRDDLAAVRGCLETACHKALRDTPRLEQQFAARLGVAQRYAVLREQQAHDLTVAWPVLRGAALRLGRGLTRQGHLARVEDVFFLTRAELTRAELTAAELTGADSDHPGASLGQVLERRRLRWERQRRLLAPLTVGSGQKLAERAVAAAVTTARAGRAAPADAVVGHPASPGRATGPVRLITGQEDFDAFTDGEILVAKATAPAWTPLFARAAGVVTDAGTLAAHASLIAREYGIPAVVGTGDATARLRTGQPVTVDGSAGVVDPHPGATASGDGPQDGSADR